MANPATVRTPMTVEEFLQWDSGDDFVWELIDGYPRLKYPPSTDALGQAAPSDEHAAIIFNVQRRIADRLDGDRRPCRVVANVTQKITRHPGRVRIPDLVVKCGRTRREARDPILIVEVNSPSNTSKENVDRQVDYCALPTLREYLLLEQDEAKGILYRRVGDLWRVERLEGLDAVLNLESVGVGIPFRDVYLDVLDGSDDALTPVEL